MDTGTEESWAKYLDFHASSGELSLQEMQLWSQMKSHGMLVHIQKSIDLLLQKIDHIEGMTGAVDVTLSEIIRQVGAPYGITYPGSATVRAALDAKRDLDRETARASTHQKIESAKSQRTLAEMPRNSNSIQSGDREVRRLKLPKASNRKEPKRKAK